MHGREKVDGDLYTSVKESLTHIYPRLTKGAIVVVDDYCDPTKRRALQNDLNRNEYSRESGRHCAIRDKLPGVKRACDAFLKGKPESMQLLFAGEECHAYFRKQ